MVIGAAIAGGVSGGTPPSRNSLGCTAVPGLGCLGLLRTGIVAERDCPGSAAAEHDSTIFGGPKEAPIYCPVLQQATQGRMAAGALAPDTC